MLAEGFRHYQCAQGWNFEVFKMLQPEIATWKLCEAFIEPLRSVVSGCLVLPTHVFRLTGD